MGTEIYEIPVTLAVKVGVMWALLRDECICTVVPPTLA